MGTRLARQAAHKVERVASVAWMVGLGRGVRPKRPTLTSRGRVKVDRGCLGLDSLAREIGSVPILSWVVLVLGRPGRESIWTRP